MKILYFDCKNGISGDMVSKALLNLTGGINEGEGTLKSENKECQHHHHHHHGRSWAEVRKIIQNADASYKAKEIAERIYGCIARAEAKVHEESLETVHFHEVGRDEAIKNALIIGACIEKLKPDAIHTSPICDGRGTVICSHGEIPVPVPAVMALRHECDYDFISLDLNMEMVTPSGLASLIGIGAEPVDDFEDSKAMLKIIDQTEAMGSRDTGRGGLRVYLLEA